ncbi:MAG: DUF4349 domain-containing protein [Lachnospiraceae bacterium]|nr:DUF4349 domain-containing protein [Lachnospiraceae bacterium]
MKKKTAITLSAIMVTAILAGCGASSDSGSYKSSEPQAAAEEAYDYAAEEAWDYDAPVEAASSAESSGGEAVSDSEIMSNSNRKLIKTVNMNVETREFDSLVANVMERINSLGGYAESTDISGNSYDSYKSERNAFIVARIPANKLDFFVDNIENESNITSKNESANDVTLQYADVEAHKESLKIEQQRLNQLLEQADNLENIIELENRLTEVRYEIESYESRLRTMNNQVEYSTVNLSIREVKEYTPEPVEELSFGQRIARGFLESCADAWVAIQDFIVGFVSILPMLLVILVILAIIFFIIFGIIKGIIAIVRKTTKNKAEKRPKQPARPVAQVLPNKPEVPENENKSSDTDNK